MTTETVDHTEQLEALKKRREELRPRFIELEDAMIVLNKRIGILEKESQPPQVETLPPAVESPQPIGRSGRPRIRQLPALDGLRGIAVLAVVIYHAFSAWLPGGFLGVDVFFVLSGFLITSLLIREKVVTGRISLTGFWTRRLRRIAPAAVFVALVSASVAGFVGGDSAVGLGRQLVTSIFFVNNWGQIAASGSYFADQGVEYFAHYWSLAIEEQFYVLWPWIFMFLLWLSRKHLRIAAVISIVGSIVSAVWMGILYDPQADPSRVYYGTDTHSFGLLLGAAVALWLSTTNPDPQADSFPVGDEVAKRRKAINAVGAVALLGLIVMIVGLHDDSQAAYYGGIYGAAVLSAVVIAVCVVGGGLERALTNRFLTYLGHRSFSLYLWHWPVISVANRLDDGEPIPRMVVAIALSLVLSELSFHLIENPFRRQGYEKLFTGKQGIAIAVVLAVLSMSATSAVNAAPKKTALDADLEQLATMNSQHNEPEAAAPETVQEHREMPPGDAITVIGDSVTLAASQALYERFPGIYIDGAVSRHYEAAPAIIEEMEAEGTLDPFVVLGFGTNGHSYSGGDTTLLTRILDLLGPDRTIIMVVPYGDRSWMPEAQEELYKVAEEYPNVYLADWNHAAESDPYGLLREDLIHPNEAGTYAYADAIAQALQAWVDDANTPQPEPAL